MMSIWKTIYFGFPWETLLHEFAVHFSLCQPRVFRIQHLAMMSSSPPPAPLKRKRTRQSQQARLKSQRIEQKEIENGIAKVQCPCCAICSLPNLLPISTCVNDCTTNVCLKCLHLYLSNKRVCIFTQVPEIVFYDDALSFPSPCGCGSPLKIDIFKRPLYEACDAMRVGLQQPELTCIVCNEKFLSSYLLVKHQVEQCNYLDVVTCPNRQCQRIFKWNEIDHHMTAECCDFVCPIIDCDRDLNSCTWTHVVEHVRHDKAIRALKASLSQLSNLVCDEQFQPGVPLSATGMNLLAHLPNLAVHCHDLAYWTPTREFRVPEHVPRVLEH